MKRPFSAYQGDEPYVFVCYAHEDQNHCFRSPLACYQNSRGRNRGRSSPRLISRERFLVRQRRTEATTRGRVRCSSRRNVLLRTRPPASKSRMFRVAVLNGDGRTPPFKDRDGRLLPGAVAEAAFLRIGGLDQWVLVRGRSVANPLLIVVHGGPGSSETAFYRSFNAELEAAFTVVYWDQRGAGRSYAKSIPVTSMTIERFVDDLGELIAAMLARFGKQRVVLMCHSWGTVIGTMYTSRSPATVAAYVGIGQVSNMAESEAESYAFVLAEAERRGHRKALEQLRAMGPPPHSIAALGRQRRWLMTFGGSFGARITLRKLIWRGVKTPEASVFDLVRIVRGSMFSLRALWGQLAAIRLDRDHRHLDVPVFFCLGRHDLQVVATVSARYFDQIDAPQKELVWFEHSGHMVPFEEPAQFNALMIERVRPLAL